MTPNHAVNPLRLPLYYILISYYKKYQVRTNDKYDKYDKNSLHGIKNLVRYLKTMMS